MLLKLAGMKRQCAIALRWAVDDRKGIETIQFNTNLHYGIALKVEENRRLRLVALADETHNRAYCLAGLLARQYEHLILVHRISDAAYWVCVIKNHAVWTGADVPKATAGDFLSNLSAVTDVVEIATAEFAADGIDVASVSMSTETASDDFSHFNKINFFDFVHALKKNKLFIVRYLESSKILLRRILVLSALVVIGLVVAYYIQQQRLVTRLLHQQQIQEEHQRLLAIQREKDYFARIQSTVMNQSGAAVIFNVLEILRRLPLQSAGWNLTRASYHSASPQSIVVSLVRSPYGTLDSFLMAYSGTPTNGMIGSNNDSGSKTLNFQDVLLQKNKVKIQKADLTVDIPRAAYRLISYMQLNQDLYEFQVKNKTRSEYGVNVATYSIRGEKLWQLVQLANVLVSFPTVIITTIDFVVNDYDMSWTLEGEIYA